MFFIFLIIKVIHIYCINFAKQTCKEENAHHLYHHPTFICWYSLFKPSFYACFSYKFRVIFIHYFVNVIFEMELTGECFHFNFKQKKLSYSDEWISKFKQTPVITFFFCYQAQLQKIKHTTIKFGLILM